MAWQEIPDPVQRVNRGETFDVEGNIVDWLSVSELNALAPGLATGSTCRR